MIKRFIFFALVIHCIIFSKSNEIILNNGCLVSIDQPCQNDINNLVELIGYLEFEMPPEIVAKKLTHYLSSPSDKIWVARIPHKVIGFLALNIINSFYSPHLFARIDSLVVHERYRKLGIGKMLIEFAQYYAKKLGCSRIFLTSGNHRIESHKFYNHLNFQSNATYFMKYI